MSFAPFMGTGTAQSRTPSFSTVDDGVDTAMHDLRGFTGANAA